MREVPEESYSRKKCTSPGGEPLAERIDGRIYIMKRPKRWHQRIVRILKEMIEEYRKANPGFCEVRTAPFGLTLCDSRPEKADEMRMQRSAGDCD